MRDYQWLSFGGVTLFTLELTWIGVMIKGFGLNPFRWPAEIRHRRNQDRP